jgi:glycerol-3-phosphate dehydrogenase (NAD(P)+)
MTRVAVIGAGAWGTTLADLLARKGEQVILWARELEVASQVAREHMNGIFLPGAVLAPALAATTDLRRHRLTRCAR